MSVNNNIDMNNRNDASNGTTNASSSSSSNYSSSNSGGGNKQQSSLSNQKLIDSKDESIKNQRAGITGIAFNKKQRDLIAACDFYGRIHVWRLSWSLSHRLPTEVAFLDELSNSVHGNVEDDQTTLLGMKMNGVNSSSNDGNMKNDRRNSSTAQHIKVSATKEEMILLQHNQVGRKHRE